MGLSVMRLTTGRSNSEWMLQGDKMPTKTKEKWEVKATGFKIKSGPEKSCCSGRNNRKKTSWQTFKRHISKGLKTVRKRVSNEQSNVEM